MTDKNPWAWWQAALAGEKPKMSEGTPHAGFYRWPRKEQYGGKRTFLPIAYWPSEDGAIMHCRVGDTDVSHDRGCDIWINVGAHPVGETAYRGVAERNEPWPDEHALVPMDRGSNLPPDDFSFEGLRDAIENLAREAEERIKGPPVADQDEADRVANLADRLAELHKKADEGRKVEKGPFDAEAERIQKKWLPLVHAAEAFKNLKYKILTPWLLQQKQAAQREAEAAAAAGSPPPETRRPGAGTRGRKQTLRTFKRAEITDYEACLTHFKDDTAVRIVVQGLADKVLRAGGTVPGAKLLEEEKTI